jgi:Ni/Co efflux regulator RcnB
MQLRRLIFLSSLVLAVAALSPVAALGAANGTDRPVKGTSGERHEHRDRDLQRDRDRRRHHVELEGTSTSTSTINLATGKGTGDGASHLSHCGTTTFHNDFTFTLTGPDTFRIVGTDTEVCASGKLFSTFTVTGTVSTGRSTGVFTITGGTGRFDDASGTFAIVAKSTIVSTVGTIITTHDTNTVEGQISY